MVVVVGVVVKYVTRNAIRKYVIIIIMVHCARMYTGNISSSEEWENRKREEEKKEKEEYYELEL